MANTLPSDNSSGTSNNYTFQEKYRQLDQIMINVEEKCLHYDECQLIKKRILSNDIYRAKVLWKGNTLR